MVKFNVDGASKGNPSEARIGGVLRDDGGKMLIQFLLSIEVIDANTARSRQ